MHRWGIVVAVVLAPLVSACSTASEAPVATKVPCITTSVGSGAFGVSASDLVRRLTSYAPDRIDLPRSGQFRPDVGGGPPLTASTNGLVGLANYPAELGSNAIQIAVFDSNADARAAFMRPRPYESSSDALYCLPKPSGFQWPVQSFYEKWTDQFTLAEERQYRDVVLVNNAVVDASSLSNLGSQSGGSFDTSPVAGFSPPAVVTPQPSSPDLRQTNATALAREGVSIVDHVANPSYMIPDPLPFHRLSVAASLTPSARVGQASGLDIKITNVGLAIGDLHIETISDPASDSWFALHNVTAVPRSCRPTNLPDEYACGPMASDASEELVFVGTPKQSGLFTYSVDFTDGGFVSPFSGETIFLRDVYGGALDITLTESVAAP